MDKPLKTWKSYEEVATYLLNEIAQEFGLSRFEGKQPIVGKRSGTTWEIDAKGTNENGELFFLVECRRYTDSRQNQERVGALAYRIIDTGAAGAILVSPLGLQEGASKVAQSENIHSVILDEDSTRTAYILKFLGKLRIGKYVHDEAKLSSAETVKVIRIDGTTTDID